MTRKYLPTLAELIDRLSILQLKEVFIIEYKEEYAKEIKLIEHDLNELFDGKDYTVKFLRAVIVLAQYNLHIWHNESEARKGGEGNLQLTHSLNGIRNIAKNIIANEVGDRTDLKIDCLAAEAKMWNPSW